jgi:phage gpG-like protein
VASRVYVKGPDTRDLLYELSLVSKDLKRTVEAALVDAAKPVLAQARRNAPYDPSHRGWRGNTAASDPGHIRDSLELRKAPYGVALTTSHPGAPVHHWGGHIAPRGDPIYFPGTEFATRAAEQQAGAVSNRVETAIDRLLPNR